MKKRIMLLVCLIAAPILTTLNSVNSLHHTKELFTKKPILNKYKERLNTFVKKGTIAKKRNDVQHKTDAIEKEISRLKNNRNFSFLSNPLHWYSSWHAPKLDPAISNQAIEDYKVIIANNKANINCLKKLSPNIIEASSILEKTSIRKLEQKLKINQKLTLGEIADLRIIASIVSKPGILFGQCLTKEKSTASPTLYPDLIENPELIKKVLHELDQNIQDKYINDQSEQLKNIRKEHNRIDKKFKTQLENLYRHVSTSQAYIQYPKIVVATLTLAIAFSSYSLYKIIKKPIKWLFND